MSISTATIARSLRASRRLCSIAVLVLCLAGCSRAPEPEADRSPRSSIDADPSLTFEDVNLEQIDRNGKKRWSILAQRVTYSRNRKTAIANGLEGKLFDDGEHAYDVKASEGVLSQNGERIVLTGEIEVIDLEDGTVFSSDKVEWLPEEDRMLFDGNVSAVHEDGNLAAKSGELLEADRILELEGDVAIDTKDPRVRLTADRGTWRMDEETIVAEGNTLVERYEGEGDAAQVVDRASADTGTLDLGVQLITLDGSAELMFGQPPVSISSALLLWDLPGEQLSSDVPLTIVNRANRVALSGARGTFDIANEVLELTGGIEALADGNNSRMTADNLTWFVATETFNAVGNVFYSQTDPEFTLRGPQAEGKLEAETFVVTGGNVVTEIVPDGSLGL